MKNKEGFTLVELLAVIAILAILVIIALPNVLKLFNEAKKNTFLTEVRTIYKEAGRMYISESMKGNKISNICSEGDNKLGITGEQLNYCITLNAQGEITSMKVGNGDYYIEYNGEKIEDLTIDDIQEGEIDISSCVVDELDDEPVDIASLSLNANLTHTGIGSPYQITYSINNASSSNLTKVKYEIYASSTIIDTIIKINKSDNFSGIYDGSEYGGNYTIKAYDQHDNLMFEESFMYCFVAGTKVKTENGYKNIEDIKVGDKVYSYNLDNNEVSLKNVLRTFISSTNDTYIMTINGETFEVSPRHQLYIIDKGWVRAYDVEKGDKMLSSDKEVIKITNIISKHYDNAIKTYNFEVEGNNNYFVTDIQVLVHNAPSPT